LSIDEARRAAHAKLATTLYAAGHVREAATAIAALLREAPGDRAALTFAADFADEIGAPDAGALYARALASPGPDDPGLAARALWRSSAGAPDPACDDAALAAVARIFARADAPAALRLVASLGALRAGAPERAADLARPDPGLAAHVRVTEWLVQARDAATGLLPEGTAVAGFAAVWGADYARVFVDLVLPAALHASNLPALFAGRAAAFLVVCDAAARAAIEGAPLAARLREIADLRFLDLPAAVFAGNPGINVLGPAQHAGWLAAAARGADAFFLHADAIHAEGNLARLRARADAGCDVFCTSGFSATLETFAPELRARIGADGTLAVPPRRLIGAALRHLHPRSAAMRVRADAPGFPSHPSLLLFEDGAALRMRYFQPGPVWVAGRLLNGAVRFNYDTSDNGLLHRILAAATGPVRVDYGADGDEFVLVDLAPATQGTERTARQEAQGNVADAIFANARALRLVDRLRVAAFETDCLLVPEDGPAWPRAPDCTPLLARLAHLARARLDVPPLGD
jgi:hypothetical protein